MTYIIGEIGQNHNGNVEIAKKIIDVVAKPVIDKLFDIQLPKMDAVKLTKRDLSYELSDSQMRRPYINKNSFAKTYGEHRAFLELNDEEHFEIYSYAKSENLDFVETGILSNFSINGNSTSTIVFFDFKDSSYNLGNL